MFRRSHLFAACAATVFAAGSANALLVSQYGVLDLAANGGINPNTGVSWQAGDQYRLAFFTADGIDGVSNDPAVYDNFATAQAQLNPALANSTGWTALVWVNTDFNLPQGDALSDPTVRAGINDFTDGAGVGGAGVPVYAMNGTTAIARNNADIDNSWSNPFDGDATLRLAAGSTNLNSNGEEVVAAQNVFYSPFLNQYGLGDTATVHGPDIWTGGIFDSHVNALGDTIDNTTGSRGNTNANTTGRVWNRFTDGTTKVQGVYAISPLFTVMEDTPVLPGDTDSDGDIDDSDLGTSLANYTGPLDPGVGSKTAAEGDTDGDGDVDDSDLGTSLANYTGPIAVSVPEPTSLALLALGGLMAARRRRA